MKEFKTRNSKHYNSLGVYLNRKNILNSHSLSSLLLTKFLENEKIDWIEITVEDLREKKIIPTDNYLTFNSWRNDMIKKEILICMASSQELTLEKPNYKANRFRPGKNIEKYINKAINENIYKVLSSMENRFDTRIDELDEKVSEMHQMMKLVFAIMPPDTEARRKIIQENFKDVKECIKLLETKGKLN